MGREVVTTVSAALQPGRLRTLPGRLKVLFSTLPRLPVSSCTVPSRKRNWRRGRLGSQALQFFLEVGLFSFQIGQPPRPPQLGLGQFFLGVENDGLDFISVQTLLVFSGRKWQLPASPGPNRAGSLKPAPDPLAGTSPTSWQPAR